MLIPNSLAKTIPVLYSQEQNQDPTVHVRLFNPIGPQEWYITEYDPEQKLAFGLVDLGFDGPELGYINLEELGEIELQFGFKIEMDQGFRPAHLSEIRKSLDQIRGAS